LDDDLDPSVMKPGEFYTDYLKIQKNKKTQNDNMKNSYKTQNGSKALMLPDPDTPSKPNKSGRYVDESREGREGMNSRESRDREGRSMGFGNSPYKSIPPNLSVKSSWTGVANDMQV
jgi:hypothetical protein